MSVNPNHAPASGERGVHEKLNNLRRRIRAIEQSPALSGDPNIAAGSIDGADIAPGSIGTGHIVADAITASKIAAGSIQAVHIVANAIDATHINAGSINAGHIAANSIKATHLQADSVTAAAIQAGTIQAAHISAGAIQATHIAADAINANHIAANSVTASEIAANAVVADKIAANAVTANAIAAGSITTAKLAAGAVTADTIAAGAITTDKIQAGAVTAEKITTTTLSAITTNMGNITAGTITGGTLQTSATGSRVVMNSAGLTGYGLDGVTKVFEINAGSGVASFTGVAQLDPTSVVPGASIPVGDLPGDRIVAGSIVTAHIAAGAIVGNHIAAGSITASKISVEFGGSNMLWNSAAEDTTGNGPWMPSGGTLTTVNNEVVPFFGRRVFKLTRDAGAAAGNLYQIGSSSAVVTGYTGSYGTTGGYPAYYPTIEGKTYTLSVWAASPTVSRRFYARIYWYDALLRQVLSVPTGVTRAAVADANSTLAAGTYYYRITAVNSRGQTTATTEVSQVVAAGEAVEITATAPADAAGTPYPVTHMRIWRSTTAGSYSGYFQVAAVGGAATTVRDTGQALTAATLPVSNTAYTVGVTTSTGAWFNTVVGAGDQNTVLTTSTVRVTHTSLVTGSGGSGQATVWVRAHVTAAPPAGAVYGRPMALFESAVGGEVHYLDGWQLEPGDIPTGFAPRNDEVLPGTVGATQITPNSITSNQIMANTITAAEIATGAITADEVAANAITAGKIAAGAVTATTISAGAIDGQTITGATIRTAVTTSARLEMTTAGLWAYGGSGTSDWNFALTGSYGLELNRGTSTRGSAKHIVWRTGSQGTGTLLGGIGYYPASDPAYNFGYIYSRRGDRTNGAMVIEAEINSTQTSDITMNNGGVTVSHKGFGHVLINDNGQFRAGTDVIAGASGYNWFYGRGLALQQSGYATGYLYRDGDWNRFDGHVRCTGVLRVETNQSWHNGDGNVNGYMQDNWGFRWHTGGTHGTKIFYGGWSSAHVVYNGAGNGTVYNAGQSYAAIHNNYSDRRHKTNIRDVFTVQGSALARVKGLRPRKWDFQATDSDHRSAPERRLGQDEYGFIAQEVAEVDPALVKYVSPDGVNASEGLASAYVINPMTFIALLTRAVQELSVEVADLRSRVPARP